VTEAERRRNDLIFSDYQRNRNPFIDHPDWVALIWGLPLQGAAGTRPLASVSATMANASEQPRYTGEFRITIGQAAPSVGLDIGFRITGSTAAADYTLSGAGVSSRNGFPGGTLRIEPGGTSGSITVSPTADAITEAAETVTLILE